MNFIGVLLLIVNSCVLNSAKRTGIITTKLCSVSIKNIVSPQPLFLKRGSSTIYPFSDTGHIELTTGQNIELFCPSTYSNPRGKSGSQIATCVSGTTFKIGSIGYDLRKVNCSNWVSPIARRTRKQCNGGTIIESGFVVGPTRFVKQLEICFNEALEVTRYVFHTLVPGSNYYQSNVPRPNFKTANFFGDRDVDYLYSQEAVNTAFNKQLDGVAGNYDLYIARGHMAAMVDFVYGTEQRGTFLFLNAAPQWQVINNGNWRKAEDSTRAWVSKNKMRVDCYTGVYGVTTLANRNGSQTPLYLDHDMNGNDLIPVPMLFFRVIIEPKTQRGVVLITVNNPHQVLHNNILCPDVSNYLTWLNWRKTVTREGYSYACEVKEFIKKNPNLPTFNVSSLLY